MSNFTSKYNRKIDPPVERKKNFLYLRLSNVLIVEYLIKSWKYFWFPYNGTEYRGEEITNSIHERRGEFINTIEYKLS